MTKNKMTKAIPTTFLAASSVVPAMVQARATDDPIFQDVLMDYPYAIAIQSLANTGIAVGDKNGYFYPEQAIGMTAAIEMIERYLRYAENQQQPSLYSTAIFIDNETYLTYEEAALILGDFIYLATGIDSVEAMKQHGFTIQRLATYGEPYKQVVETLHYLQVPIIEQGSPRQTMTRGEFSNLLYYVIGQVIETGQLQDLLQLDDFLFEKMKFTKDGSEAMGAGALPGTTVVVRNMYHDVIGTSFVKRDGSYRILLSPAVENEEQITLHIKDEENNRAAIEKKVQLVANEQSLQTVTIDFSVGVDEEGPLVTILERFLHVLSAIDLPAEDEDEWMQRMQEAHQTLVDWNATNEQIVAQLDQLVAQVATLGGAAQQVKQALFTELKVVARMLQEEEYSQTSWQQLENSVLQVSAAVIEHVGQIQCGYAAVAALSTRIEEQQQAIQSSFQALQETILAIDSLLVATSIDGQELAFGECWTTCEEKKDLQQAVERAVDIYIKFDPAISEVLDAQNELDLAVIRYEEAKRQRIR